MPPWPPHGCWDGLGLVTEATSLRRLEVDGEDEDAGQASVLLPRQLR